MFTLGYYFFQLLEKKIGVVVDLSIKSNDKFLKVNHQVEVDISRRSRNYSVTSKTDIDSTKGKSNIYLRGVQTGREEYEVEGKFECNGEKSEFDLRGNIVSLDELFLKLNVDSPKYKINKFQLEVAHKPATTAGKRIAFYAKSADKNYCSGR